jgi:aminoglycoside phosphotransferase (APT) family kinase protein
VRRCAAEALEVAHDPVDVGFVHGDLIPGNLLVAAHRLSAIIDWGGAAYADLAQDLAPAWALFDERTRPVFREAVGANEATWLRARAFELEHAVGGVLYYTPRRHPLGDVMARTLRRILEAG